MTQTRNSHPAPNEQLARPERLNLSATQVVASGLAAISSTVAASYFGVAGTVIGAAFGAVLTVVGNAVYGYSLRRTRNRVLDLAVSQRFSAGRSRQISTDGTSPTETTKPARTPMRWHPKRLAFAAAGLFVVLMAATTAFEYASGQPLSATVTGNHGSGVSVVGGTESHKSTPANQSTAVPPPSASTSGTVQPSSASPTVTVTVTPSTSSSSSTTDSGGASSLPSSSDSAATTPTPTAAPSG